MYKRILPPINAPEGGKNWPLSLDWSGEEYDIYLRSGQAPDSEMLLMLRTELNGEAESSEARWGVFERGEGRINLLPPTIRTQSHEHVATIVTRLFAEDFI